jgi:fatty-acyl-CoA synthase
VPDAKWGEQVAAFVRLVPGAAADETELFEHVRGILAPHKTPRVWRFVTEFPMTGSGKVKKHVLRDEYLAGG